jgi:hypothetical protein
VQCCLNISFDDENLSQGEKYQRKFISFSFFKKVPLYQTSDGQVDYLMGSFPFEIIWNNC